MNYLLRVPILLFVCSVLQASQEWRTLHAAKIVPCVDAQLCDHEPPVSGVDELLVYLAAHTEYGEKRLLKRAAEQAAVEAPSHQQLDVLLLCHAADLETVVSLVGEGLMTDEYDLYTLCRYAWECTEQGLTQYAQEASAKILRRVESEQLNVKAMGKLLATIDCPVKAERSFLVAVLIEDQWDSCYELYTALKKLNSSVSTQRALQKVVELIAACPVEEHARHYTICAKKCLTREYYADAERFLRAAITSSDEVPLLTKLFSLVLTHAYHDLTKMVGDKIAYLVESGQPCYQTASLCKMYYAAGQRMNAAPIVEVTTLAHRYNQDSQEKLLSLFLLFFIYNDTALLKKCVRHMLTMETKSDEQLPFSTFAPKSSLFLLAAQLCRLSNEVPLARRAAEKALALMLRCHMPTTLVSMRSLISFRRSFNELGFFSLVDAIDYCWHQMLSPSLQELPCDLPQLVGIFRVRLPHEECPCIVIAYGGQRSIVVLPLCEAPARGERVINSVPRVVELDQVSEYQTEISDTHSEQVYKALKHA